MLKQEKTVQNNKYKINGEKKEDIRLKFCGKDEIILDNSLRLDKYLSS